MAAVAAAAKAGIPRRRLVSLAVFVFFVFCVFEITALHTVEVVARCHAMEGSVWADNKCLHMMTYPPAIAVVSLLLLFALCRREAMGKAETAGGAKGDSPGPNLELASKLNRCDAMAEGAMIVISLYSAALMILGTAVRYSGERLLLQDPDDKGAAARAEAGSVITNVGFLAFWLNICILVIPCVVLRLTRFIRKNRVST